MMSSREAGFIWVLVSIFSKDGWCANIYELTGGRVHGLLVQFSAMMVGVLICMSSREAGFMGYY